MPALMIGLAPVRGSSRVCTVVEVTTIIAVIGRKASPVVSGERPRCCCM